MGKKLSCHQAKVKNKIKNYQEPLYLAIASTLKPTLLNIFNGKITFCPPVFYPKNTLLTCDLKISTLLT